jgi:hypothetical protein
MTQYVALLRGINVGGKNLIKMAALKACFQAQGFGDVATYIQSGNVLLGAIVEPCGADSADRAHPPHGVRSLRRELGAPEPSQMRSIVEKAPMGSGANRRSTATTSSS